MLSRLFPKQFDNNYRGYKLAIWLFVPIVLQKLAISVNVLGLNPWVSNRWVIQSADGIPLDTFDAGPAEAVVLLFTIWGLGHLLLNLLSVLVVIRYRAMIPFMYLLLSIDQIGRKALALIHPIVRTGDSGGSEINLVLLATLIVGLALSLAAPRMERMEERESATRT